MREVSRGLNVIPGLDVDRNLSVAGSTSSLCQNGVCNDPGTQSRPRRQSGVGNVPIDTVEIECGGIPIQPQLVAINFFVVGGNLVSKTAQSPWFEVEPLRGRERKGRHGVKLYYRRKRWHRTGVAWVVRNIHDSRNVRAGLRDDGGGRYPRHPNPQELDANEEVGKLGDARHLTALEVVITGRWQRRAGLIHVYSYVSVDNDVVIAQRS